MTEQAALSMNDLLRGVVREPDEVEAEPPDAPSPYPGGADGGAGRGQGVPPRSNMNDLLREAARR